MPAALSGIVFNELQVVVPGVGAIDANNDGFLRRDDDAIELHNLSSGTVDISGWELWDTQNNTSIASKLATINPGVTMAPGGYFTIVEASGDFNNLDNVGPGMQADRSLLPSNDATFALFNPTSGDFILLRGETAAASETTMVAALEAIHPSATQVGTTEVFPLFSSGGFASVLRETDGSDTWVNGAASLGAANCFAEDTLIATPDGERRVQDLAAGDLVCRAGGGVAPVLWLGRQTIVTRFAGDAARLVRIAAGVLDTHRELRVTQEHGMLIDGVLVNAGAFVGLPGIDLVPLYQTPKRFAVYHVETEAHDVIVANGAASETFIDYTGRRAFDNFAEYLSLYGAERIYPEMKPARITSARLLPEALRTRLGGAAQQDMRQSA
ncbi:Hint domain-containing protein [Roseicyclus mahoneyensis]|uniref:Intein n=1 Tax=Roseicyclus mahoneyensis TaxID=164332 RepID=A0A316GKK5_9RHOB|nr:Hint domain-containing protein [Roseicyclus mahoneyensis]PWK61095.1 intein [Roseicyclus mahoneyensis]